MGGGGWGAMGGGGSGAWGSKAGRGDLRLPYGGPPKWGPAVPGSRAE